MRGIFIAFLIFSSLSLLFIKAGSLMAIECAPGDVVVKGEDGEETCLYGSDIIPESMGSAVSDPKVKVRMAVNISLGFLGILIVAMVIYGGFLWATSAGNDEKIQKGKRTLVWAAIGGIVISIAWTIASYILQIGKTIS